MDMKKISCFVLVAALFVGAVMAAHEEAAHDEKKPTKAASAPEAAGADVPDAAAASGPASDASAAAGPAAGGAVAAGPGVAGAPGPSASGANAVAPLFILIGASLVSLVSFYLP